MNHTQIPQQEQQEAENSLGDDGSISLAELVKTFTAKRPPIIHGLLREGETMNVIAQSKVGKSWLVYDLALSVATGEKWLGQFQTVQGNVLLIDNELHPETLSDRISTVARAMEPEGDYFDSLRIKSLRGKLQDVDEMLANLQPGRYKIIIIDAWYRALPEGTDENSNGDMTALYNKIDSHALRLGCAFVLIHHASKGNQSGKSITDTGSGAGAQSRAADTHLILRPHEVDNVAVLEAVVRSWPSVRPVCLKWKWPCWEVDPHLDPSLLKTERPRRTGKPEKEAWDAGKFVAEFVTATPQSRAAILEAAEQRGLSARRAVDLFRRGKDLRMIHEHPGYAYAIVEAPPKDTRLRHETKGERAPNETARSKRVSVSQAIQENPERTDSEIAEAIGVHRTYVGRIRNALAA